jgi:hypothetical protein
MDMGEMMLTSRDKELKANHVSEILQRIEIKLIECLRPIIPNPHYSIIPTRPVVLSGRSPQGEA